MKTRFLLLSALVAASASIAAVADVVVQQEPLRYENIRGLDGAGLYQGLCASCHGVNGKGNGPAAAHIDAAVPDLTNYSDCNTDNFPHRKVESAIFGRDRDPHADLNMPAWGTQFMYTAHGWNEFMREAYARDRIHELAMYIETLQD